MGSTNSGTEKSYREELKEIEQRFVRFYGLAEQTRTGWFYVFQLMPNARPTRIKMGYTDNIRLRGRTYRVTNPSCKLLWMIPCSQMFEMDVLVRIQERLPLKPIISPNLKFKPRRVRAPEVFDLRSVDDFDLLKLELDDIIGTANAWTVEAERGREGRDPDTHDLLPLFEEVGHVPVTNRRGGQVA